jgi:hypothetical protein
MKTADFSALAANVLQDMLITQKSSKAEQAVRLPEEITG